MFKKINYIIVLFICLSLFGCNNNSNKEHTHKYEEGYCECGEIDPNFEEKHEHEYIDGKCACGESDPVAIEIRAIEHAIASLEIPETTEANLKLPKEHVYRNTKVTIKWSSFNLSAMNDYGYIKRKNYDQTTELTATLTCGEYEEVVTYNVTVLAYSDEYRLDKEMRLIEIDTVLTDNTVLPTIASDTDIQIEWVLSHPEIFDNAGNYNYPEQLIEMKLTLILKLNGSQKSKEFTMIAFKEKNIQKYNTQNIIDSGEAFNDGLLINLEKNDQGRLVLMNGHNEGTYISPVVETSEFDVLVGSWSAVTNQTTGSVELFVRVLVDGIWSDYFTYGEWRLGDENKGISKSSSNGVAKMDEDTVFVQSGKTATAYQYKVEFNRVENTLASPELTLVANCIQVAGYEQLKLDYSKISQNVLYDVPQLNQNIVPVIGNSICSPTSTTMLLKFYGHSFAKEGFAYEHQYVASLAKDYGHNMYGNWVYNVAVMGAYGEYAYVKRFINNDELMWHLENIGPVALSVKGNMQGYYNTSGHLLVCKGYKIVDGEVIFICNDPNIKNVEVEYTYETIENVWREIAYVIEPSK